MRHLHGAVSFLFLPILFTLSNLLLALLFTGRSSSTARADIINIDNVNGGADLLVPAQHEVVGIEHYPAQQEGWDDAELQIEIERLGDGGTGEQQVCDNSGQEESCADEASSAPNASPTTPSTTTTSSSKHLSTMPEPYDDFEAYVQPDISTFYQEEDGSRQRAKPRHQGMAGKFMNLTPEKLNMYWLGNDGNGVFMGVAAPFAAYGTGTFPNHRFYFTPPSDPNHKLCEFVVQRSTSVYYCDPYSASSNFNNFEDTEGLAQIDRQDHRDINTLSPQERAKYEALVQNLHFGQAYKNFTGREWLSQYPRNKPRNFMWEAEYFGQNHSVQTKQTQFVEMPPSDELTIKSSNKRSTSSTNNDTSAVTLQEYRANEEYLDLTLTAMSCAPRIFEIPNFLSDIEVNHLLALATQKELPRSTTGMGDSTRAVDTTRTSRNTWVGRESSPIVDAIYRRAADVLKLDEALLRRRSAEEHPDLPTKSSIAEPLQVVHYDEGQEYTAHHDFGYPTRTEGDHPSRWANILLYLNDPEEGGETSFPRWANGHTDAAIDVKPKKGSAALFYMLLDDGNLDDLSQHAALPVKKGEKWMANMWLWDPIRV